MVSLTESLFDEEPAPRGLAAEAGATDALGLIVTVGGNVILCVTSPLGFVLFMANRKKLNPTGLA